MGPSTQAERGFVRFLRGFLHIVRDRWDQLAGRGGEGGVFYRRAMSISFWGRGLGSKTSGETTSGTGGVDGAGSGTTGTDKKSVRSGNVSDRGDGPLSGGSQSVPAQGTV